MLIYPPTKCYNPMIIPAITPLVLVPGPSELLVWKSISESPTNSSPTSTVNMPTHICFLITLPRNATDNKAVNIITAPENTDIHVHTIRQFVWSEICVSPTHRNSIHVQDPLYVFFMYHKYDTTFNKWFIYFVSKLQFPISQISLC